MNEQMQKIGPDVMTQTPGNATKIRDAMEKCLSYLAGETELVEDEIIALCDVMKDALASPARECDRFADEKQADALHAAFIEYCNGCDCPMGCIHRKDPRFLLNANCASIMKCFARFALSKATLKEGGAK